MKSILLILLFVLFGFSREYFITEYEYGKMLYDNPRGIGCSNCHGSKGEGKIIAEYYSKGKKKVLKTDAIWAMSLDEFKKALHKDNGIAMPRYHLTDGEINALYYYLSQERKREK